MFSIEIKMIWQLKNIICKNVDFWLVACTLFQFFIDVCLDALFGIWSNQKHEWNKEK